MRSAYTRTASGTAMLCTSYAKGVALPDIQRQLGHLNLATTDVYLRRLGAGEHVEKIRDLEW